jgi:hypothetical protein
MHKKAQVGSWQLQPGSVVLLEAEVEDEEAQEQQQYLFGMLQCMWEDEDGEALAQVRGCDATAGEGMFWVLCRGERGACGSRGGYVYVLCFVAAEIRTAGGVRGYWMF